MSEESKKLSDEERFQLDRPPKEEPDYGEYHDPTWQELAESYIKEHDKRIKVLEVHFADLEEKEPTSEKEVTVAMSLRSWNSLGNDLKMSEHYLVGVLTKIRNIRVNISHAMGKKLVDQARSNLSKTMELGEMMDEHSRELEKLAKEPKDEDTKEA